MDILQKFKRELLEAKYGKESVEKRQSKRDLLLKEAKGVKEKGNPLTEIVTLIKENKVILTEENYDIFLGFHTGDGWTVAHELVYVYKQDLKEWPEVYKYTDQEGVSVKDIVNNNVEEREKE